MNIYGKKVVLRAIEEKDLELIQKMFNDPEMESLVVGWAFPISMYSQEQWLKNNYNDQKNQRYIIETLDGESVGLATLVNIDWKNRSATHGMKLLKTENRSKGIGTDTVMAIMRYAFDELGLNRLDGAWFEDNIPSKKMYEKCGWIEEGKRRKYIYKNGKWKDLYVTGILAEDYYKLIENNNYWED